MPTYVGVQKLCVDGLEADGGASDEVRDVHGPIGLLPRGTRRVRLTGMANAFLIRPNGIPNGLVIRHSGGTHHGHR
jgi:hypothetical protein